MFRRASRERVVEVGTREPSLGALLDLRLALGLLSGDELALPDPLDGRAARRVLDALADATSAEVTGRDRPHYADEESLAATARAVFAAFDASVRQHEAEADVSIESVAEACLVDLGRGTGERTALERGLATAFGPAEYFALLDAPLYRALLFLGHQAVQMELDAEDDEGS